MRLSVVVLAALVALSVPAVAQPVPSVAPGYAQTQPDRPTVRHRRGQNRAIRAACRAKARHNGRVRGFAREVAVSACFVRARPQMAARERCRLNGVRHGYRRHRLQASIQACLRGGAPR